MTPLIQKGRATRKDLPTVAVRASLIIAAMIFGCLTVIPGAAQTQAPSITQPSAAQTTLTVTVSGLRNTKGQVLIWLWNGPDGFPKQGDKSFKLAAIDADKAVGGTVTAAFAVPPGSYAVTMLHDENKNSQMDTNFLGIPAEGYGASNNPITHFGPPSFEQARFQVPASGQKIAIVTHY